MPTRQAQSSAGSRKARWICLLASLLLVADLTRGLVSAASFGDPSAAMGGKTPTADERDAADRLARSLALGTRRVAAKLMRSAPSNEVRKAATGDGAARLLWPVKNGSFVRGFGFVRKVQKRLPHLGVDISGRTGTPIRAAAGGLVAYADDGLRGYGNLLMIVHPDGAVTSYAHCSRLIATPGQRVTRGDVVALVGSTGISKGPHLHFELRIAGKPISPMARFDRGADREKAEAPAPVGQVL